MQGESMVASNGTWGQYPIWAQNYKKVGSSECDASCL